MRHDERSTNVSSLFTVCAIMVPEELLNSYMLSWVALIDVIIPTKIHIKKKQKIVK